MPFVVHGGLAFLAIVPSFFLVRESAPIEKKGSTKNKEDQINTRALLAMMLEAKYLGFLSAQFFASMTRGVLWGGTLLLYAALCLWRRASTIGRPGDDHEHRRNPDYTFLRLSNGPLWAQNYNGTGIRLHCSRPYVSCIRRSMALEPCQFRRRFSLDSR